MQLHLRTWGKGDRVVVLIHGLSSHATSWDGVGTSLAERGFRVVAPDLRGHGSSTRGFYSVNEWTDDALEPCTGPPKRDDRRAGRLNDLHGLVQQYPNLIGVTEAIRDFRSRPS
jgi:pimeloyl-ACP methyl ester carboxylesterase